MLRTMVNESEIMWGNPKKYPIRLVLTIISYLALGAALSQIVYPFDWAMFFLWLSVFCIQTKKTVTYFSVRKIMDEPARSPAQTFFDFIERIDKEQK